MANFEFKPFDKVLVRKRWGMWIPAFYGVKIENNPFTSAGWQDECIPYEGNEEYLGTYNNYVDKVSKFKVGNWLVENEPNNYARFVQILEIVDIQGKKRYRISRDIHKDHKDEDVVEFRFVEKYYHKFDIHDAKDGDVLHSTGCHNDCIFIFDRLDNWKFDEPNGDRAAATGYCCLFVSADKMEFGMQGPDCIEVNTIKPATKIQRELLFQKMKEVGYEWDAEKKELKKIEQKHTEWSDEDSLIQMAALEILMASPKTVAFTILKESVIVWFKSLKDRVLSQPKQEWSDEDKKLIDDTCHLINTLASGYGEKVTEPITFSGTQMIASIKDRLRALVDNRPQNHWKPSDKQMELLREVQQALLGKDCHNRFVDFMYELKRLREE